MGAQTLLPSDNEFRAFWFSIPHHRRQQLETLVETCHVLKLHTELEIKRGDNEIWAGLRKRNRITGRVLSEHLGIGEPALNRWERGHAHPSTQNKLRYQATLRNIAVDLYHQSLTTLLWHLHFTDQNKNAPKQIDPESEPFHHWITDTAPGHPILTDLSPLPHDNGIPWPPDTTA